MPEYEPLHKPGDEITVTASANITGEQAVVVTGDWQVGPSSGASAAVVGHAAFDAATGQEVKIFGRGIVHRVPASGAISAGARVDSAANGAVASASAGNNNLGIALAAAADGYVYYMEI